jgi:hypothetical protein
VSKFFVRIFGRIEDTKKTFQNLLTEDPEELREPEVLLKN